MSAKERKERAERKERVVIARAGIQSRLHSLANRSDDMSLKAIATLHEALNDWRDERRAVGQLAMERSSREKP